LVAVTQGVEYAKLEDGVAKEYVDDNPVKGTSSGRPNMQAMVQWQYSCHHGHAASFVSTLLYGPVMDQGEAWCRAGEVLREKHATREDGQETVVLVCGSEDTVVPIDHVREDLDRYLGKGNCMAETVPGGHGFPLAQGEAIVDSLSVAWRL